jgi:transposase
MKINEKNIDFGTQISGLQNEISGLNSEISKLSNIIKEQSLIIKSYEERLKLSAKKKFGSSSEKSRCDSQISMQEVFNEAELINDTDTEEDKTEETTEIKSKVHKRKRTIKESLPENTPITEIKHELTEEERICPVCGESMHEMGQEHFDEFVVIPARVEIKRHITSTYTCRNCEHNASDEPVPFVKSSAPNPVIKGSHISAEAIAHVAVQKYVMGVPLYRQEKDWERKDIHIMSRQTTSNWLIRVAKDYGKKITDMLKSDLLSGDVLHADETTLQVLKEPGKKPQSKSYIWEYRSGSSAESSIVLYDYQPDRRAIRPETFLNGFSGYVHADGYQGYHNLPEDITIVGCWSHLRRKFYDALTVTDKKTAGSSPAAIGMKFCDDLFALEREFADMTPEERFDARIEKSKPLMEEYDKWARSVKATPKSYLGKAIVYGISQWKYLTNVLLDGRLEISNNRAERSIKPFVIARKNFLFANTPSGAMSSAILCSLIETAKENQIDPYLYLTYVFSKAPTLDMNNPKDVRSLLPTSYKAICAEALHNQDVAALASDTK